MRISWLSYVFPKQKLDLMAKSEGQAGAGAGKQVASPRPRAHPGGFARKEAAASQLPPAGVVPGLRLRNGLAESAASRETWVMIFAVFYPCACAWRSLASDLRDCVCRQFANFDCTRHFWLNGLSEWVGAGTQPWPSVANCDLEQNLCEKSNCLNYCSFICF